MDGSPIEFTSQLDAYPQLQRACSTNIPLTRQVSAEDAMSLEDTPPGHIAAGFLSRGLVQLDWLPTNDQYCRPASP